MSEEEFRAHVHDDSGAFVRTRERQARAALALLGALVAGIVALLVP